MPKLTLEEKFVLAANQSKKEINQQLEIAEKALQKAISIAEEYGTPVYSNISFISQSYRPESFDEKWENLDLEEIEEELDIHIPEYTGWQHSAVC